MSDSEVVQKLASLKEQAEGLDREMTRLTAQAGQVR